MTDVDALRASLADWRSTQFRLEALDRYEVDVEQPAFGAYLRGEWVRPADPGLDQWLDLRRLECAVGKRRTRVHAIAGPLTAYLAFEIDWAYTECAAAGEEIRIAQFASWQDSPFGQQPPDFYILDDERVIVMEYSAGRRWVGGQLLTSPDEVEHWRSLRDLAITTSVPLAEYLEPLQRPLLSMVSATAVRKSA